ncbi:MAG: hypothetical protein ACE5JO_00235 [Candidatus Binatia bacterium]
MKTIHLLLPLVLAGWLAACSQIQPISRDQMAANIDPILKLENRIGQVKYYTKMLISVGGISDEKGDELKAHHDIYYVYYLTANVQLARGNMESYVAYVKAAESELDLMEAILKDRLDKFAESASEMRDPFSRSGL